MKLTEDMLQQHAAEARDLWLSTLPQEKEVPSHTFSRRFERKLRKLRAEQRRSPRMNRIVHVLRYVAACAAVVLCIGGTAYAYRVGVIDMLIQRFKEYTSIQYSSDTTAEDAKFPTITWGYLPEGMVQNKDTSTQDEFMKITAYENPQNNSSFTLYEDLITSSSASTLIVDTENAAVRHFVIGGEQAMSAAKAETVTIVWTHQSVSYTLITQYLSYDEALKIAEGIQQK